MKIITYKTFGIVFYLYSDLIENDMFYIDHLSGELEKKLILMGYVLKDCVKYVKVHIADNNRDIEVYLKARAYYVGLEEANAMHVKKTNFQSSVLFIKSRFISVKENRDE